MPISKEEWDRLVKKGQQELKNRTQVTESSPSYTPNQNVVNKLRAAHYASETAGLSTPKQNRDTAELLFGGAFAPSYLADYAYEDLQNRNAQKFNKQMTKAESLFADKTNMSYDEAKDEVEYQKELEKNKKKADVYAAQGGENRDEYEAALNKESADAYGKRKAVKAFSYEYSNQTRDEMDVEQKNLQSQYDAETDEYKKFAIEQQMQKAKKYSDSLLSSKEIQQKINENQKIIDDYTKKYVAEGKKGVTQEEIDAYAKARDDLDYYKNLLNPAIVNEWDDDVYALEPDDMQAFSIVYQYEKQRENDEKAGVEDFNDPYRQSLDEQYRTAYNYLKQKYTEAEIKEMSKKFTYVADRDTAYQTSQDIINDIADKTGAERLPYVIGLGLGTALDAYNAPVKIIDGLVQSLTGEPINVYDSTYSIATINNAIQQGLVQQSAHQKAASMAVGVYCSLVQMGATMGAGIASGVEGLSLFLMGSSAASQTMKDMAEKGASNDKIIASSIATGVAEALFEKVSLEGWLHPENILASARVQASLGETVKALLVQWGCEISEEICTDIANEITDYIINGGNSNAAMTIEAYKNMGYSQKQAENMYLTDFGEQLGDTALSSAIISMFMTPSSVISTDVQIDRAIRTAQAVANTTYGNAEESIKNYVLSGQSSEDADNIIQYAMEQTIADYAPKYEAIKQTVSETANEAMNAKYTVKGEERVRATNKYSEKDIDRIADFAAKRGVNVRFATFNKKGQLVDANGNVIFRNGANGFYTTENGQRTIYLNPRANANMALSFLAGHEISHDMQGTKEYDKLKEMVMDFYDRNVLRNGKVENELDAIRERAINTYYEEYKNMGMSDEQIATAIEEEIVADALGTMLQEGNLLRYVSNNIQSWQHGFPKLMQNLRDMFSDRSRADTIFGQYLKAYNTSYSNKALSNNRFSLKTSIPIEPTSDAWTRNMTYDEVKAEHPTLFELNDDENSKQNPTQIAGTVKTYEKIYDIIENDENFTKDSKILDASSGLGIGTEAGRERGLNVDDVEPYPAEDYSPKFTDYSAIKEKYDYIISNAVLNVLPQDLRDDAVYTMKELLADGGKMYINVRGKDVLNASTKTVLSEPMEVFIESTGSYQKGFTKKELVAYLKDALGEGFTVVPSNKFGAVSAVVTKDSGNKRFSVGESVIIGNNTLNYDNLNDEGMRKLVEYANKHKASWQLKNVNGEQTIGRYVRDEFVPVSENTLKSIIKKYNEDNDTIASDVYDFVSSSTDSEIDNAYNKALQDDKNIADNIINAEATKAGAITENGKAQHLYLGTISFGYTVSNPQYAATGSAIWTSTSQAVAKGYAMTDNIQGAPSSRVRPISSAYVEDDGTIQTLLKNAKNILNIEYTDVNSETKKKLSSQLVEYIEKENNKIAEAIQGGIVQNNTELYSSYPSGADGLYNDAMKLLDYTEALNPRFNDYYADFTKEQIQSFVADWNSEFKDAYGRLKSFFYNHQAEINNSDAKKFFSIIDGYELSDFLIDVESFIDKLYSGDHVLSYESPMSPFGVFFTNESDVRAAIDRFKNFGTYDLYGFAGDKPLVVDAEGASWLGIKFPQLGEDRTWSTDRIVKWAQDNGYTSVNIKNVYDNAYNGADGDDWIFFNSEQLKSADTATYDNNGKLILPSERFNLNEKDWRWSKGESTISEQDAINWGAYSEDNIPVKFYHGSPNYFTEFDKNKARSTGLYGKGFYFTREPSHASSYGENNYEVYLQIKSPLKPNDSTITQKQALKFLGEIAKSEDYDLYNYSRDNNPSETLKKTFKKDAFSFIQDISAGSIGDMVKAVELFNEVNGTSFDGIVTPTETVVFEPNQIKSTAETTFDDNGNPIPRTERFSTRNDTRYSMGDSTIVYPPNLSSADIARSEEFQEAYDNQDYRTAIRLVRERADAKGYIVGNFHHGRVSEFTVFDRSKGNRAGNWGNGFYFSNNDFDAEYNYGSEGSPDLNAKIDNLAWNIVDNPEQYLTQEEWDTYGDDIDYDTAEKIARDRYITAEPSVIDAFLQIDNPAVLGGKDRTFLELYEDEDTGEIEGELLDFLDVLRDIRDEYDYFEFDDSIFDKIEEQAWDEGGIYLDDLEDIVRQADPYAEVDDEYGVAQEAWAGDILAHAFEAYGYDGIVDNRVSKKFPMMTGMDSGTTHYVVFKPEQIKDASPFTFDDNGKLIPLYERFNDENPDIRYSKGESVIRQYDNDNGDDFDMAAEMGDEETCSKILDGKAMLKGAVSLDGKNPLPLYLGTKTFGYTKPNRNDASVYSVFFATDDFKLAAGYTGGGSSAIAEAESRIRSIDEGTRRTKDRNWVARQIKALNRKDPSKNYELVDFDGRSSIVDDIKGRLMRYADDINRALGHFATGDYEGERGRIANDIFDDMQELADAMSEPDYWGELDYTLGEYADIISNVARNLHKFGKDNIKALDKNDAIRRIWNILKNDRYNIRADLDSAEKLFLADDNNTLKNIVKFTNEHGVSSYYPLDDILPETYKGGVYSLYGFLGNNPLIIEGNGAHWTSIPLPEMGSGDYSTDDIAQWAYDEGYSSVWFKDIIDPAEDAYYESSNVFAFFAPEQMKSRDPITYDDNGKVIPLKYRLATEKGDWTTDLFEDYRYQTGESTVESNGDWEELRRRYGEEEPVQQTPQTPRNNAPTRRNNDTIRREVLPNIGNVNSLSRTRERVGGRPEPLIGTGERRQNIVNRIRDAGNFLATKFIDSAQLVRDASLRHGTNAYRAFTNAKGSSAMASNALGWYTMENGRPVFTGNRIDMTGQVVGNPVAEVFYPYAHADESFLDAHNVEGRNLAERQKNHLDECQTYLVMKLNRDVIESTGRERISGYDLAESVKIIHDFESKYGMEYANALSRANREVTDYVADLNLQSGTLTQEDLDTMRETYPNYVPTLREDGTDDFEDVDMSAGRQGVMGEQRRRATGGGRQLIPLLDAYESKINSAMRFGQRNIYFNNLLQTATQDAELARHINVLRTIPSSTNQTLAQILGQQNGRANTYVAFTNDGGAVVFEVDNVLNTAVKDLTNPQLEVEQYLEGWQTINRMWRGAVTTKNPLFMVSNAFRDMGQAMLMSESVGQYWKDYGRAIKEMRADSELYKQFQASGVMSSSISEGLKKAQNNNFFTKIEGMGEIVEMLPRFSAYLTQIEKYGNTYEGRLNAQFAAKDITTNFSQGGDWTRMLNRNGFNFLNANVQGLLQIGRKITDPLKNPSLNRNQRLQALGGFAIRLTALGFAPYAINAFLIGLNPDRKRDYDELSDSIKTQYLLFPVPFGDGNFIRIPYGRALVISTTLANLAQNAIEGKKIDVGESLKTIWDNVGVAKPSGLWTPVVDAHNNKTWYGGTLVNYTLAQREKEEQYDESTDEISKELGKLFNISPKKVNYVLDQWSGFIGDFVLPAFTQKYQSDNPIEYLTNPIVKRFTTDAVSNNDLYDTYNDMFTEVKKQAATDGSYYGAEQYFYSQSKEINSIWTQIHEVQRYKSLSQEEKDALQQKYMSYGSLDTYKVRQQIIRDMRKAINGIQRNTIENYDYIIDASSKYPITDDMTFSQKKTQTFKMNNDLFGSEYALQTYGGDTWDNAQLANTCGIDFESYAQYFANTVDLRADKDENGNTISGTLKKKKWEALSSMNLSEGQRAFLFAMEYKISQKTNYYDSKALQKALNDYINSLPLSDEEKKYLKDNLK